MSMNFPNSPTIGQTYSAVGGPSYVWNGTAWDLSLTSGFISAPMSDTPPINPYNGMFWTDTTTMITYQWYVDADSSQWVQVSTNSFTPNLGGWEWLGYYNLNGAASYDFIGLAAFEKIRGSAFYVPSTGPTTLQLRVSTDNGATFDTGSNYNNQVLNATGTSVTTAGASGTSITLGPSSDGNVGAHVKFEMQGFNLATVLRCSTDFFGVASAAIIKSQPGGAHNTAVARNAFRLFVGAGTTQIRLALTGVRG